MSLHDLHLDRGHCQRSLVLLQRLNIVLQLVPLGARGGADACKLGRHAERAGRVLREIVDQKVQQRRLVVRRFGVGERRQTLELKGGRVAARAAAVEKVAQRQHNL